MKKLALSLLAALSPFVWAATEVDSYAQGYERVGEDGWVLLCHSADWDSTHDEQWMRRQSAIRSACGNALVLYIPVYQNPTEEQTEQVRQMLQGSSIDLNRLRSVPCAILLDRDGRPYTTVSGDDFTERAAGIIRNAQSQLRTRSSLIRQASQEEGSQKAQTLSRIWRLNIAPPPNLRQMMHNADPQDTANISEWSPFDPWALADRVRALPYEAAMAELDRVLAAQLSKEERQAVLAIRMGCVRHHLGTAGVQEIRNLAHACTALAPGTPLGKAAQRAASSWGNRITLRHGWDAPQLPLTAGDCELAGVLELRRDGEFRIGIVPVSGEDPIRITRITLYDGETKLSEDAHSCCLKAGEESGDSEYMLIVRYAPTHPRLIISFDQQGKRDTRGYFTLRHLDAYGKEDIIIGLPKIETQDADKAVAEHSTLDNFADKDAAPAPEAPAPEDIVPAKDELAPEPAAAQGEGDAPAADAPEA